MIARLPMPPTLALPLPPAARRLVRDGEIVRRGQLLACGDDAVDVVAPADGQIGGLARRTLAADHGASAPCLLLRRTDDAPSADVCVEDFSPQWSPPTVLKKCGIVGLGGGAFPAWRKWRRHLRLFIANAVGGDPLLRCDAALLDESAEAVFSAVMRVGEVFADQSLLAVADDRPLPPHPLVRRVPMSYALGNERLLIQRLSDIPVPAGRKPADCGVVCFNIGTVLAMAAALRDGAVMNERVITVHHAGTLRNVRVAFGATVGDVRRFLAATETPPTAFSGDGSPLAEDAVIAAASTVLRLSAPPPTATAQPCIRCGACEPVCPVQLSPQTLWRLAEDERWTTMAAHRLDSCLSCRRCDEVCPSRLPLTAAFDDGKRQLAAAVAEQDTAHRRQRLHDAHTQRQQQQPRHLSGGEIKESVAALLRQTPPPIS